MSFQRCERPPLREKERESPSDSRGVDAFIAQEQQRRAAPCSVLDENLIGLISSPKFSRSQGSLHRFVHSCQCIRTIAYSIAHSLILSYTAAISCQLASAFPAFSWMFYMPIKVSSGTCLSALAQLILTSASEPEALRCLPFIRCIGICL